MWSLNPWASAAAQPPTIKTNEIFPLHYLDNKMGRLSLVLSQTLLFHSVLDPTKLHDGLVRLVSNEFTAARPAVLFSAETLDMPISEHPVGGRLPRAEAATEEGSSSRGPSLHPGSTEFKEFSVGPGWCTKQDDYLCRDDPVLGLRVIVFTDATVVSLVVPQVVAGALGFQSIFKAWSAALLDGNAIPPLLGVREDVIDSIGGEGQTMESCALLPKELKGWGFVKFISRLVWNMFWRPTVGSRSICLPRQFVSRLHEQCIREAEAAANKDEDGQPVFLSDGDVPDGVADALRGARAGRDSLRDTVADGGVYVQNLAGAAFTDIGVDLAMNRPLGEVALAIRGSIQEQATEAQMRALIGMYKADALGQQKSLFGDPEAQLVIYSNCTMFDLFNVCDFGVVVVKSSEAKTSPSSKTGSDNDATMNTPPGKPVYMHCRSVEDSRFHRDAFFIMGKDLQDNYWTTAFIYPEDFAPLEDHMEQTWERIR
ncbi:lysr family regulatory protein [Apiospora aurea]|uniref:Lysr family regulatory protein n=1 Tax=Apiospora aurea TaxID=335848 RepID=A0ABR1Q1T7_9PEZI